MEGSPQPGRKEVVAALTGIVKRSPLKAEIDPKAFFMMVSGNFQVLYQNGTLDLSPLWAALSAEHSPDRLSGIFLKWEESLSELGIAVRQPDSVRALSADQRSEALALFDLVPEDLPLEALAPAIPPERRQAIVSAVALAVRASPIGPYISSTQLQFVVGSRLDELSDGNTLDFGPLRDMLLEVEGTDHSTTYNVFLRLSQLLTRQGVTVTRCEFPLSEQQLAEIETQVEESPTPSMYEALNEPAQGPREVHVPRPSEPPRPRSVEEKLKKYGLEGVKPPPKVRLTTIILALLVLGSGAGLIYLFQPSRTIDHSPYDALLPLERARIFEGRFLGHLDVPRWRKLTVDQRQKALTALGEKLAQENKLRTAAIVNEKGGLCMFPTQDGKLGVDLRYLYLGTDLEKKYTDPPKSKKK